MVALLTRRFSVRPDNFCATVRPAFAAIVAAAILLSDGAAGAATVYEDPNRLVIEDKEHQAVASYTTAELKKKFAMQTRVTGTPWTGLGEKIRFRGVLLKDVLERHGLANEQKIEVHAYDDFRSEILKEEIETYSPILALERECTDEDRKVGLCDVGQEFRPLRFEDAEASGPMFMTWPIERLPVSYVPGRNAIWVFFVVAIRPG